MANNKFKEFVEELADSNPIEPGNYTNFCKFCTQTWCESGYDEYLDNAESLKRDKDAKRGHHLIRFMHHDEDCLWVKANKLVREHEKSI